MQMMIMNMQMMIMNMQMMIMNMQMMIMNMQMMIMRIIIMWMMNMQMRNKNISDWLIFLAGYNWKISTGENQRGGLPLPSSSSSLNF